MKPLSLLPLLLAVLALLAARDAVLAAKPAKRPKWIHSFAGPWIVSMEKVSMYDEKEVIMDKMVFVFHIRISHWNPMKPLELQTMNGSFEVREHPITDNSWIKFSLATRSNNQWKENALVFNKPRGGCSFFRANLPLVFGSLTQQDPYSTKPCRLEMGYYPLREEPMNYSAPNFPILPYGMYQLKIRGGAPGQEHLPPRVCDVMELLAVLALQGVPDAVVAAKPAKRPKWIHSYAGPWIMSLEKLVMCDEKEIVTEKMHVFINLRLSHWNPMRPLKLQVMNGSYEIRHYAITDESWIKFTLATRSNNEWKENAIVLNVRRGGCSFFRTNLPLVWQSFRKEDPNSPKPCRIDPGLYFMREEPMNYSAPNFPILPYGLYQLKIRGGPPGQEHLPPRVCAVMEARVVPRVD